MAELLDSVLTGFETIEKLACYLATPRKSIIFFRDLLLMNRLFSSWRSGGHARNEMNHSRLSWPLSFEALRFQEKIRVVF